MPKEFCVVPASRRGVQIGGRENQFEALHFVFILYFTEDENAWTRIWEALAPRAPEAQNWPF